TFTFNARVSRGTYIRSLVVDIAAKSNSDAYMSALRRIEVANLDESYIDKEIPVEKLLTIPTITTNQVKELFQGKKVKTKESNGLYALKRENEILGIVKVEDNLIKPKKLFGNKL
ncbi:MAG: tRNA pseudouridine(55) synthase TruB, partial [Tenericutes bacterium]